MLPAQTPNSLPSGAYAAEAPATSAARPRKRGGFSDAADETGAKVASFGPAALAAIPAPQQRGETLHGFFARVPDFCQDVARRIGHPIEQIHFHTNFINQIRSGICANEVSVEKVLELTTMMLGQSLNLTGNAIRDLLQDQNLYQQCEALKARLVSITIQDLDSPYDEVAEQWVPGPLFGDIKNFCNVVEIALLHKFGIVWQNRFVIHQLSTQAIPPQ